MAHRDSQVVVRVSTKELAELDALVGSGAYESRADVLRAGLAAVAEGAARRAIAEAYRRGYTHFPQEGDDLSWVEAAGAASLSEPE